MYFFLNSHHYNILIRSNDGGRIIFDDFREAYWWLRENTPEDAKVSHPFLMSSFKFFEKNIISQFYLFFITIT